MATQSQYNTTIQPYRNISIKLEVLDFNYYILDEISGVATSANFSIDADSDIRRTCNINMILKDDYSSDPLVKSIYWQSGNPFWFDKYLRINIGIDDITTGETVWNNQGIYLINEPSLTYNATTNELSFEGLDLMADLTGIRNGNLEGISHEIPVGTNIVSAIKDILLEQNFTEYILNTPPQSTTPYEIKTNAGGTSYDLLSQLRDINADWEMFFDVNGVFYFQQIASNTTSANNVTPLVDMETFKLLHSSAVLDTSFEDVKNYIEVYGGTIETDYIFDNFYIEDEQEYIQINIDGGTLQYDKVYTASLVLGDSTQLPQIRDFPIKNIYIDVKNIGLWQPCFIDIRNTPMLYDNMSYVIRFKCFYGVPQQRIEAEYLGYTQPFGMAWDNNELSPFYVGEPKNTWKSGHLYAYGDKCYYSGAYWESLWSPNRAIPTEGSERWRKLYDLTGSTDAQFDKPEFKRQVRIVLSGGEYDNIYSNDLAMQRARYELYLRSARHDNIQITLLPIYWIDVNQIIEYQMPNEDEPSYWLVKNVNTNFSVSGTQNITAIRYYFNK